MALKIYTTSAADLRGTAAAAAGKVATPKTGRHRAGWVRQYDANVVMKATFKTKTTTTAN